MQEKSFDSNNDDEELYAKLAMENPDKVIEQTEKEMIDLFHAYVRADPVKYSVIGDDAAQNDEDEVVLGLGCIPSTEHRASGFPVVVVVVAVVPAQIVSVFLCEESIKVGSRAPNPLWAYFLQKSDRIARVNCFSFVDWCSGCTTNERQWASRMRSSSSRTS